MLATLRKHWRYAHYVWRHKVAVFQASRLVGVPFLGAVHDLSKLRPDEWGPYAWWFYGKSGMEADEARAKGVFDRAWLLHIHRNRHHPQFWVLRNDTDGTTYLPIPERYVREMIADWMGAGMAIKGHRLDDAPRETRRWWAENRSRTGYAMHPETLVLVERLLVAL